MDLNNIKIDPDNLPDRAATPEPAPFDIDGAVNSLTLDSPITERTNERGAITGALQYITRPFLAQGYNAASALNRGLGAFSEHLDSITNYLSSVTGIKKSGIFESAAKEYAQNTEFWKKRAEQVGMNFFDELVSEAVGGAAPGITQFSLDVASGYTFPAMAGAGEAQERGEDPFMGAVLEAAKTGVLHHMFRAMSPLKQYLKAPLTGTVFGVQSASEAPEGRRGIEFAKGFGTGLGYSLMSPGGQMGLNEIRKGVAPEIEKARLKSEATEKEPSVPVQEAEQKPTETDAKQPWEMTRDEFNDTFWYHGKSEGHPLFGSKEITGGVAKDYRLASGYTAKSNGTVDMIRTENLPIGAKDYIRDSEASRGGKVNVISAMGIEPGIAEITIPSSVKNPRKYLVEQALKEGKPVPESVLKDYPDLSDKQSQRAPVEPKRFGTEEERKAFFDKRNENLKGDTVSELRKKRKFLNTVKESPTTNEQVAGKIEEINPQDYVVQPNAESLKIAEDRITRDGIDNTMDYLRSEGNLDAEKGASFIKMMDKFQQAGDFDRAIETIELYDTQLREAGRFVQAASIWNRLTPTGFLRWAEKQLKASESKYGWLDTIFKNKPDLKLSKAEKDEIFRRMSEINKMPEGVDKTDATLQMIDVVAQKAPPSVSEVIDAYRYQNMLSSPRTQQRNIGENLFNAFITAPIDITTKGAIDYMKAGLFGKDRKSYVKDAPLYMKTAINSVPNATKAFMEVMKSEKGMEIGKPDIGVNVKSEFERARFKQIPSSLTVVGRFMEASDKFFSSIIGAGEFAIQKKNGASDAVAYQKGAELGQKYLYRAELDPKDPNLGYFSKVLSSVGKLMNDSRKLPGLGKISSWYVPFIRTPVNKGIQMVERSPLGIARGSLDEQAAAQIVAGSIFSGIGAMFAYEGKTTWVAPSNKDEKALFYASGKKPFSVRIGDKWVPVWYLGPYALAFALPAAAKYYYQDRKEALTEDKYQKLLNLSSGVARFVGSQTSTQSIGAMFQVISGDMDYSFPSTTAFTASQLIPLQGLVRYTATIIDPVYRKPNGFIEEIEKNLPFFSEDLEARKTPFLEDATRDRLNYFVPYDIGEADLKYEALSPTTEFKNRQTYINNKMNNLIKDIANGKVSSEDSIDMMADIFDANIKNMKRFENQLSGGK
jgi:hypothetical protein